jgi:signal transduction histidine kinase
MKVGQRLFVAVLPAIFGVFLRDFVSAITRGVVAHSGSADELDTIESKVHDLDRALTQALEESDRRVQAAEARAAEYSSILAGVAHLLATRLQDAELPLHVLLSSPFGSLNENQEELLAAARLAVEAADSEVRRLCTLLDLDHGTLTAAPQCVGLKELLRPALAMVQSRADVAHVTIRAEISDAAPRVTADLLHVQAALTTIFTNAVAHTPSGGAISIVAAEGDPGRIRIVVKHTGADDMADEAPLEMRLARRLIILQHGTLPSIAGQITIELPSESVTKAIHATPQTQA